MRPLFRALACALPLMAAPAGAGFATAADITAEQSALVYDLLKPVMTAVPPSGTDPAIFGKAISILKEEHLAGQGSRPHFTEKGILDRYGKALFLGARTPQFAGDIGHIRDLVEKGDRPALEQSLRDLWAKADRAPPDTKALDPVIKSLYGAKGEEPEETVHRSIDKPGYRVEIAHARAGGKMQVDVTTKNPDGTDRDRTSFQGVTETAPTPDGQELQRRIRLDQTCTSTPETDAATVEGLNGDWTSGAGETWTVTQQDGKITLTEKRAHGRPLEYTGTYRLGQVAAAHPITEAGDMGENLPMQVRQQLTTKHISFRIALDFCSSAPSALKGTWSSQHVTYDGMFFQVSRIHDPYDLSLNLSRAGEKVAQGAAQDEIP
ncbi:MAG: hypothetical protein EPN97_11350 [Alphaproteobacteria bacterium]|nr:MAG: hypothetical protein EPN97_11350 [Alphaproteobacteria bacterium]